MLTLKWPKMTPRLACPSDSIFLRKFILLLLTFSWKCPVFWALFFTSFIQILSSTIVSSKIMDKSYIQLVLFSQLKGFWTWIVHPSLNFMRKWTSSIFIFHCVWIHTFLALCMKFSLPRLEYRGEFLLHHQDRAIWIILAYV